MPSALRIDRIDLGSPALPETLRALLAPPERTAEGFLRVEGFGARVGVQAYPQVDGSVRYEYRGPEEVFDAASLASWRGRPLALEHPEEAGQPVALSPDNAARHMRGVGLDAQAVPEHGLVKISLMLHDAGLIDEVFSGRRKELSAGYTAEVVDASGVAPDGTPYDAEQRHIAINHIAVTRRARAGALAQVRTDTHTEHTAMTVKLRLDGRTVEVNEADAAHIEQTETRLSAERAARTDAERERDAARAEKTALAEENARLKGERDTLQGEKEVLTRQVKTDADLATLINEGAQRRFELVAQASTVLRDDSAADLLKLTDRQLREKVVRAVYPDVKLDAASSDDYVSGMFNLIVANAAQGAEGLAALRTSSAHASRADAKDHAAKLEAARVAQNNRLMGRKPNATT